MFLRCLPASFCRYVRTSAFEPLALCLTYSAAICKYYLPYSYDRRLFSCELKNWQPKLFLKTSHQFCFGEKKIGHNLAISCNIGAKNKQFTQNDSATILMSDGLSISIMLGIISSWDMGASYNWFSTFLA